MEPDMQDHPIRVLLVEDDEDDYLLTRDLLAELPGNRFHLERASTYEAALKVMGTNRHDVYLLDYRLGARTGLELLREAVQSGCQGPMILLTGQGDREVDLEAMKGGAADYLIKGQINASLLERSIRYAIEGQRHREALRQARDDLEKRVQERTAALDQANRALQTEINDRKRLEQELRQRAEQLAEADRRKDEFLAMLAHELRNPLAPIRNGLYILQMPNAQGTAATRAIHLMEQQVRNLTRLVDDLLDVSRISRGKIQLHKETVNLAVAVAHAVETVRPLTEAQGHELTVSLPWGPVHLDADPTRLEQVLCNLLNNAAKYTDHGGHISLTVERQGEDVLVRVRDTGIGIPVEMLPRVFDLFTQGDRSLDRSQGGLGIGLTLVRKLVELMGGSVTANSEGPGKGSEFVVRLPALKEIPLETPEGAPALTGSRQRLLRVLVVEDLEGVADMLVMLLKLWGHDVRAAHDGPAALIAARTFQPDVVLLDIGLPGMNGYEVARQLRREAHSPRPLIAAVTGYGKEEDRRHSREAGFDHHMVKPIDPNALEAFLAAAESLRQTPLPPRPRAVNNH
jgi:two-component system CheB/CheR fusion protein